MQPDVRKQMPHRKRYQKPEISRVKLVAEEAVLAGCKFLVRLGTGPGHSICAHPIQGTCFNPGS